MDKTIAPLQRNGQKIFFRVLAVAGGILFAALMGEVALRLAGYTPLYFNPLHAFHEAHPLVGHRGKPNFEGRFHKPDFEVVVAHDENGFRRQEHQLPLPLSQQAVWVFGDSFTWGWGVGQGRGFTDVMSQLLPGTHVANFGLNASGTVQHFTIFEAHAYDRLRPGDIVLLMFFSNDFEDNLSNRLRAEVRDGKVVLAGPARELTFRPSNMLRDSSYLVNLIVFSANRWKATLRRSRGRRRATLLVELGDRTPEVLIVRHYLAAFQEACREKQAKFLAAYIPEQAELGEVEIPDINREKNDAAFHQAFLTSAESLGIPVIDFLPPFLEAKRAGRPGLRFTYLHDSHWNEAGHALAGEIIARFIQAKMEPTVKKLDAVP